MEKTERNADMIAMYCAGKTLREIGITFSVSYETVRMILKRNGYSVADKPKHPSSPNDTYHGAYVPENVKMALRDEAAKTNESMSKLTVDALKVMLKKRGYKLEAA